MDKAVKVFFVKGGYINMQKKVLGIWLVLVLVLSIALPQHAEAKQVKVKALKGNTMRVGQTKTIKANQVVTWRSLNKKLTITSKKKAKKVTIRAKRKGTGILEAKRGKATARIRIKIKKKPVEPEDVFKGGLFYILEISDDIVELAIEKDGIFMNYVRLNDTIKITKDLSVVSKDALQIGQSVLIQYETHQDKVGGMLCEVEAITILEEKYYITEISEKEITLSLTKDGSYFAYVSLEEDLKILRDEQIVSKNELQVGQYVELALKRNQYAVGGRGLDCTAITIIEK